MISAILAMAAAAPAYGTDPSPAGVAAARDMLKVSAAFCGASFRGDPNFDPAAVLTAAGFGVPGTRNDSESGSLKMSDFIFRKPDESMHVYYRSGNGQLMRCAVWSPRTVWNQLAPSMPAYVKATGLPLLQDKSFKHIWRGGRVKLSIGDGAAGGTLLTMEWDQN